MQLEIYGGVPVPNQHVEVCTTVNSKASNVLYSFVCIFNLWFRVQSQSQSQRGGGHYNTFQRFCSSQLCWRWKSTRDART
jgi:hypothetical protein